MRGENIFPLSITQSGSGTSPRARGKLRIASLKQSHTGNIPACAGKTDPHQLKQQKKMEHPRVRGENDGCSLRWYAKQGTSPRARGKHFFAV